MQTVSPVSETGFPAGNAAFRFSSLVAEPPCLNGVLSRINQKLFKYRLDRTGIYWWTAIADDVWLLLGVISLNVFLVCICVVWGSTWLGVRGPLCGVLFRCIFFWVPGKEFRSESGFFSKCFVHWAILLAMSASFVCLLASCDSGVTVNLNILSVQ